jgi:hypothetical protein
LCCGHTYPGGSTTVNFQLTPRMPPDHPDIAQMKLRFMPMLIWSLLDDADRAPVDPCRAPVDPVRAQDNHDRAPVEPVD